MGHVLRSNAVARGLAAYAVALCFTAMQLTVTQAAVPTNSGYKLRQFPPITMPNMRKPVIIAPSKIRRWIDVLSDGNTTASKRAETQLVAAGDAALPAAREALHVADERELQKRLRAALNGIYLADTMRGPLISVQAVDAPLKEILQVICSEAGLFGQFRNQATWLNRRLTINVDRQPFWKILKRIARVTGVSPSGAYGEPSPGFSFSRSGFFSHGATVAYQGAFALVVKSIDRVSARGPGRTLTLMYGPGPRALRVRYTGLWVPNRHTFVQIRSPFALTATGQNGHALTIPVRKNFGYFGASDNRSLVFGFPGKLPLGNPSARATVISQLIMAVPVTISMDPRTQRTGILQAGNACIKYHGMSIHLTKPSRSPHGWNVSIDVHIPKFQADNVAVKALTARLLSEFYGPRCFLTADGSWVQCTNGSGYNCYFAYRGAKPARAELTLYRYVTARTPRFNFTKVPIRRR